MPDSLSVTSTAGLGSDNPPIAPLGLPPTPPEEARIGVSGIHGAQPADDFLPLRSRCVEKGQIKLLGLQRFSVGALGTHGKPGSTGTARQNDGGEEDQGRDCQVMNALHVTPRWVRFSAGPSMRSLLKTSKRHGATSQY